MPASPKIVRYYEAVAPVMLPFLTARKVAVELKYGGREETIYRRHTGQGAERQWIAIESTDDIMDWVRRQAIAFHGNLEAKDGQVTFFLDIDSRSLSTEMARLGAIHAFDLIEETGLEALVKYSGSDGFHLMWKFPLGAEAPRGDIWAFQRDMIDALAAQVDRRLVDDPRAAPIRAAVGRGEPLVVTSSADRSTRKALLFDKLILKRNANGRVPYSLHAKTLRSSVPLDKAELADFRWQKSLPGYVADHVRPVTLPIVTMEAAAEALARWTS